MLKLREKFAPVTVSDDECSEGDVNETAPRNTQRRRLTNSSEVDLSIVKLSEEQALQVLCNVPKSELERLTSFDNKSKTQE